MATQQRTVFLALGGALFIGTLATSGSAMAARDQVAHLEAFVGAAFGALAMASVLSSARVVAAVRHRPASRTAGAPRALSADWQHVSVAPIRVAPVAPEARRRVVSTTRSSRPSMHRLAG
jgi:hypothetical protein